MYDRISFFGKPIKTLGSLGKIRVGRVTGNTHIFFWPNVIAAYYFIGLFGHTLIFIIETNIKYRGSYICIATFFVLNSHVISWNS